MSPDDASALDDAAPLREPTVPLDEVSLGMIETAMATSYRVDPDGTHRRVGGTLMLDDLLNFWSGYDSTREVPAVDEHGHEIPDVFVYEGGSVLSEHDVIRAMIAEIRRLRRGDHDAVTQDSAPPAG